MKNLNEYETPITNNCSADYQSHSVYHQRDEFHKLAMEFERKLAMCRDALESVLDYIDACTITESPDWQSLLDAREALDQTR